jgi:nucleoside-diphosphate-sugar epimerase
VYALTHADPLRVDDSRVQVVRGEITDGPGLGLAVTDLGTLTTEVTALVHLAADTRFSAPLDDSRRTNVNGTVNVLTFAERCRRLDRIIALSTTHVAGRRTGRILEDDLEHTAGFVNSYEETKYAAEQKLRSRSNDLPIAVCRLSTVVGDSRSGEISRRGAIHQAVLFMYASLTPMVPGREDSPVDLLALDYAAQCIAFLATDAFEAGAVWHLCAGAETISAGELLDLTLDCIREYRPAWRKRSIARPEFVGLDTFQLFRQSVDEIGDAALRDSTAAVSHFAPQLAFPKWFDDRRCRAVLSAAGLEPPAIRDVWRRVVRRLVQPNEGASEAAATNRIA